MIESGSEPTEYEAYSGGYASPSQDYSMPIHNVSGNLELNSIGKNLINKNSAFTFTQTTTFSVYIPEAGQYTLSLSGWSSPDSAANPNIRFGNGPIGHLENKTVNLPEGALNITIYSKTGYNQSAGISLTVNNLMLSKNGGEYKQYQGESVTFPLSQGQKMYEGDYLADDGIHHARKQETVSGLSATFSDAKTNGVYLCSQKQSGTLEGQTITFESSVTDAVVEYELATPVVDAYTEAQQTAWNNIKKLQTYKNITHIMSSSDDLAPELEIVYYKDLETILDNITNAILTQGNNIS